MADVKRSGCTIATLSVLPIRRGWTSSIEF